MKARTANFRQTRATAFNCKQQAIRVAAYLFLSLLLLLISQTPVFSDPLEDMKQGEAAFGRADIVSALNWFRKAAEADYAPAQARLAGMLDHSENNEEAVIWYRKAAEQNNADGQYGLGSMYASGDGIDKDYQQAVKWLSLAAGQGHSRAIRTLVTAYETGGLGLEINKAKAEEILNKGVEFNDSWAKSHLKKNYQSDNDADSGK